MLSIVGRRSIALSLSLVYEFCACLPFSNERRRLSRSSLLFDWLLAPHASVFSFLILPDSLFPFLPHLARLRFSVKGRLPLRSFFLSLDPSVTHVLPQWPPFLDFHPHRVPSTPGLYLLQTEDAYRDFCLSHSSPSSHDEFFNVPNSCFLHVFSCPAAHKSNVLFS